MEELLEQLEARLKVLLDKVTHLEQAQEHLKQDQLALAHEKRHLQEKQALAISQIERMIARLKPLEEST